MTVRYSYKINFPATTKKLDTTTQLYCTLSTYVTPKRHNKKTDTTAQLYCTLSTYVTPKTISFFLVVIMIAHPPDRRLYFFPVVITIAHLPGRRLYLFFLVVITIAHPPDRRLYLFFPVVITRTHSTTVLYTNYVHNIKIYFPPEPNNQHTTTTVLYSK